MTRQNIFKMTSKQNLYNDTRHQVWAMIKKNLQVRNFVNSENSINFISAIG